MLNKREWLRLWNIKMYASGEFDPSIIKLLKEDVLNDWKNELSPGEVVEELIAAQIKMEYIFGWV